MSDEVTVKRGPTPLATPPSSPTTRVVTVNPSGKLTVSVRNRTSSVTLGPVVQDTSVGGSRYFGRRYFG